EQFKGSGIDARADIYSLGVVLFEMLSGDPPFDGDELAVLMYKHLMEPTPSLPPVCAWLQPLVDQMMSKDPAGRPQSATALIELIDQFMAEHPEHSPVQMRRTV